MVGWGSFSHLRTEQARAETLAAFARVTTRPMIVSFLEVRDAQAAPRSRLGRLRRRIPRRAGREPGDRFSVYIGFFHATNVDEVGRLAERTGLEIVERVFDQRDTNWPHVVLRRRDAPSA